MTYFPRHLRRPAQTETPVSSWAIAVTGASRTTAGSSSLAILAASCQTPPSSIASCAPPRVETISLNPPAEDAMASMARSETSPASAQARVRMRSRIADRTADDRALARIQVSMV